MPWSLPPGGGQRHALRSDAQRSYSGLPRYPQSCPQVWVPWLDTEARASSSTTSSPRWLRSTRTPAVSESVRGVCMPYGVGQPPWRACVPTLHMS